MLKDKKILLCLCGGIAVYKCVDLASMLVKAGATVKTVMTESAMEFVTPLTFKSITKESVSYKMFNPEAPIEHISLADWADLIVIAPATANIIGKIANGIADDLLSTTVMAAKCPKLIVPAMNVNMWENPIVQENIDKLKRLERRQKEYLVLEPDKGVLACGYEGKGRLPAVEEIVYAIKAALYVKTPRVQSSIKVLVTAGASVERIDPMRHITNVSSGKMGLALARVAYLRGAEVTIIHSSISEKLPYYTHNIEALSAQEMYAEVMKVYKDFDIIIMCAAVADYTPESPSKHKIKKKDDMAISLIRTKDILLELGKSKRAEQVLIGFAAESENLIENAKEKLIKKNLDVIVANDLSNAGKSDSEIFVLKKGSDSVEQYGGEKFLLANEIFDSVIAVSQAGG